MKNWRDRRLAVIFRLPYLPVWLVPLILFAPLLVTGRALFWGTPFFQFIPWRYYAWTTLLSGQIPLWNPLNGMGAPLLANYQTALLYPPNWLLFIFAALGGVTAMAWGQTLIILLHVIWAGLGMICLARSLKLNLLAQTVSGLAFGLSSYLISRSGFLSINAAVPWLPWVIFFAGRIAGPQDFVDLPGKSWFARRYLPLTLSIAMLLLAGHAQTAWYTLLLAGLWVLFWGWRKGGIKTASSALLVLIGTAAVAGLISAIQLLPTAEYLLQSQRATAVDAEYAMNYSFWPWRLISLLAPDFFGNPARGDYWFNVYFWEDAVYVGLLPVLMAMAALIRRKMSGPEAPFTETTGGKKLVIGLWVLIVITFVIAMGRYTPVFPFLYRYIPTFNMFQAPARWTLWVEFALCLLAGIGIQGWRRPTGRGLYWTRLGTAGAFAITLGAGLGWLVLGSIRPTFIQALALAGLWATGIGVLGLTAPRDGAPNGAPIWRWGVVLLLAVDLLVADWGMIPGYDPNLYKGLEEDPPTLAVIAGSHRLFVDSTSEQALKYDRFLKVESYQIDEDWRNLRVLDLPVTNLLDGISSANNFDPLVPGIYADWMKRVNQADKARRSDLLRWMDVSVIESADPQAANGVQLTPLDGASRWHWAECALYVKDASTAQAEAIKLANPGGSTSELNMVILEDNQPRAEACSRGSAARISVILENPNLVRLSISADSSGWLIQSDVWYPGWVAAVDGKSTPIQRADGIFRAVKIPSGSHEVVIEYRPLSFYLGGGISILAILAISVYLGVLRFHRSS